MKKQINKIKDKLFVHKTLVQNFSYLSALQIFNLLVPLITYPYLIRVVGKETYGLVVFSEAIIQYLVILVEFGFNISATKEVSIHRENKNKLSEIISSVLVIKGVFFIVTIFILSLLIFIIPQAKGYEALFFLSLWACLYNVIFPIWYFQGIEKMKYITYITLVSRLTFLGLIFLFIHSSDDYLFIPIINGIGALLAGITSLYIIFAKHHVKFVFPSFYNLKIYLNESVPIFISNVSIKLYVSTNKIIVGAFLGMSEVAYYDLGEKIISFFKTPLLLVGTTLFPKISKERNKRFLRKAFFLIIGLTLVIVLISFIGSDLIIKILGGEDMKPAKIIFQIMLFSLFPISVSLFYGNLLLLTWGFNKDYFKSRLYTFFSYTIIILLLYLTKKINLYSLSLLIVIIESITALLLFLYSKKNKIDFLQN